ncbi:MAG: anti-sigma factor antagonist [Alphaproteobacteria bacterium]|nr:STAS domain-containing protein [Alphaproteobacteria bacterium]NCB49526.1 anti-sigma factor antagonist [Alphaproteobacteria bacterium]
MDYKIEAVKSQKEVSLIGTFTFRDHDKFFEIISLIKKGRDKEIVFELSQCDFIDSAALGMFVIASDEASIHGTKLKIKGVQGRVKDVMFAARFDNLYEFVE